MKQYFLARYLKEAKYSKSGEQKKKRPKATDKQLQGWLAREEENKKLSDKAEFWRRMALKKVGSTVKIPERRFIGTGRNTDRIIREITEQNFEDYLKRHPIIDK